MHKTETRWQLFLHQLSISVKMKNLQRASERESGIECVWSEWTDRKWEWNTKWAYTCAETTFNHFTVVRMQLFSFWYSMKPAVVVAEPLSQSLPCSCAMCMYSQFDQKCLSALFSCCCRCVFLFEIPIPILLEHNRFYCMCVLHSLRLTEWGWQCVTYFCVTE